MSIWYAGDAEKHVYCSPITKQITVNFMLHPQMKRILLGGFINTLNLYKFSPNSLFLENFPQDGASLTKTC